MNRKTLVIAASFCIVFAGAAQARPLSLKDAVNTALVSSPEITGAEQDATAIRAKIAEVRAAGRLTLGLDMDYVHLNAPINLSVDLGDELKPAFLGIMNAVPSYITVPVPGAPAGTFTTIANPYKAPTIAALQSASYELTYPLSKQDMRRFTLNLQKPIFTSGRVKYGVAQVKNAYKALDERAESKRREIALSAVSAYLGAVLAKRVADVMDEAYQTVSDHVKEAESLFKQGLIPKYELMRAQTELANQDRRRLDAKNQSDLAVAYLMEVIGKPDDETPDLTTPLNGTGDISLDYDQAAAAALDANTDMKALKARDRFFAAAVNSAKAERLPVVALFASADLRDEDLSVLDPKSYVGIMAKMPILDGGVAHAKITQQIAQRERNKTDITRLHNGIKLIVRKNYLDFMSAKKALEAADTAVDLATESKRLAVRRFEVGEGTSIEVTDAVLALSIAETNREQARYQYDLAFYSLKEAMGQIIDEFSK